MSNLDGGNVVTPCCCGQRHRLDFLYSESESGVLCWIDDILVPTNELTIHGNVVSLSQPSCQLKKKLLGANQ